MSRSPRTAESSTARLATLDDDTVLLHRWAAAFDQICGQPVVLEPLDAADAAVGIPGGQRLTFPPIFDPIELIGGSGHFQHHPAMAEQVRWMGFAWDDTGRIMTVPAPGAFNARLAAFGVSGAGFRIAYANGTAARMPLGPWLLRYCGSVITVLVNAPAYYDALLSGGLDLRALADARWGLMSLAHDLSVHALNYHLIPHAAVAELASRIRAAIPDRYAAWSNPDTIAPLTLTYFFDNDFNRYTYAVWCRCERPQDFGSIFSATRNFTQLVAALDVRLEETKAGYGDVASGDFDDMKPLTETSFDVT